jgi:hypothetical protein
MSYRERARRRFLERGRVLGMPRPLVLRLWSEAPRSTVWPDFVYSRSATPTESLLRLGGRVSVDVGDGRGWQELGAIRDFTESPLDEELRRPVAYGRRSGKRTLLDRLRGRS